MNTVHQAMRAARLKRGLKQWQLAKLTGMPQSQISNFERGKITPGLFPLIAIADALDISIDEYIGRERRRKHP